MPVLVRGNRQGLGSSGLSWTALGEEVLAKLAFSPDDPSIFAASILG